MFVSLQCRMAYHPTRTLEGSPADFDLEYEDVYLTTDDGLTLNGWYIPSKFADASTLLFFHGNAGNISHRVESIDIFHDLVFLSTKSAESPRKNSDFDQPAFEGAGDYCLSISPCRMRGFIPGVVT